MATIKLKRGTSAPTTSDIADGEVAIDKSAQKLYLRDGSTIKEIGGNTTGTTLDLSGALTGTTGTFTTADNLSQVRLISTDADANKGPRLDLFRNSASPAAGDFIGRVRFLGEDSANHETAYVHIDSIINDPTDGAEDGQLRIEVKNNGTMQERIGIDNGETVINEDSANVDFRVESNNQANMFFVDGSTNRVGINTNTPDTVFEIRDADPVLTIRDTETSSGSGNATLRLAETGSSDTLDQYWDIKADGGKLQFIDNWTEGSGTGTRVTIDDAGKVGILTDSPIAPLHVAGNAVIESGSPDLYLATTSASHTNWRIAAQEVVNQGFEIASGTTSASSNAVADTYTTRFTIKSDGKTGIGTTAPAQKLDISGGGLQITGNISTPASGTSGILIDYYQGVSRYWSRGADASTKGGHNFIILEDDGGSQVTALSIGTDGNSIFNGNLEVGDDTNISMNQSIAGQLTVDGSGYHGAIALDATAMHVYHNASSRALILGTNETAALTIAGSNQDATFSSKLDVNGAIASLVDTNKNLRTLALTTDNFSNEGVGVSFSRTSSDSALMAIGVLDTDKLSLLSRNGIIFGTGGSSLYSQTSEVMRIDSSGNVGIGTTSPSQLLHVDGHAAITSAYSLMFGDGGERISGNNSSEILNFFTGATERMRIASTGYVGIGTTAPTAHLDVTGNTGIYVRDSGGGGIVLDDSDTADASTPMVFMRSTAGTLRLGYANRNSSTGRSTGSTNTVQISPTGIVDFINHIDLPDSKYVRLGNAADMILYHDGTNSYIQSQKQDGDIFIRGNDGGTSINALQIDFSANGAATFSSNVKVGKQLLGGFGSVTTSGTLNWNDVTNARSGMGYSLLQGGDTNGPELGDALAASGGGAYYHITNWEYSSTDGGGNLTQVAIPYHFDGASGKSALSMRSRYSGTWTGWYRYIHLDVDAGTCAIDGAVTADNYLTSGYLALSAPSTANNYALVDINDSTFDFQLRQYNGSSWVTSLTIDQVNQDITVAGSLKIPDNEFLRLGAANDLILYHNGTASYIQSQLQDADIHIRGNDGGTNFNALSFDMSNNGAATFNSTVSTGGISANHSTDNGVAITANDTTGNSNFSAMRIDYNVSGSDTLTGDRTHIGLEFDVDSSASGGDTSNEHRLYGQYGHVRATNDSDLIYGSFMMAEAQHGTGTVSQLYGLYGYALQDSTGGTISNSYGTIGLSVVGNDAGTPTGNAYGAYGKSLVTSNQAANVGNLYGGYFEVEIDEPGANNLDVAGIFAVSALIDNDDTSNNASVGYDLSNTPSYLFYGNYTGTLPGNAYGLYILDDVTNYLRGSLGVGTTNPTRTLTISSDDDLTAFTGTSYGAMYIQNSDYASGEYTAIDFGYSGTQNPVGRIGLQVTASGSRLSFGTSNDYGNGVTNQPLTINYNGCVGINTTTAAYTLDVDSTIHIGNDGGSSYTHSRLIFDSNGSTRGAGNFYFNQVNDVEWFAGNPYNAADGFSITRASTTSHTGATSNITNSKFYINSSGNVGIGTTSPSQKLHVAGDILSTGALYLNTSDQVGLMLVAQAEATVGPGWMSVATNTSGRRVGEIIVTDGDSGDHSYVRIDWMRSYADSNFTVLNCGGHSNRITGVRVISEASNNTYGEKILQVYVTVSSTYEVSIYHHNGISDFTEHTVVTPVIENTKSGYNLHGAQIEDLDDYSLASEEGIQAPQMRTGTIYANTVVSNNIDIQPAGSGGYVRLSYAGDNIKLATASSGVQVFGSVTEISDESFKVDVQPIQNALATVTALKGVTYSEKETGNKQIGFIAQDIEKDAPDLAQRVVQEADPDSKLLGLNYSHLTSVLAEAIKEQQVQIEQLTAEIKALKEK